MLARLALLSGSAMLLRPPASAPAHVRPLLRATPATMQLSMPFGGGGQASSEPSEDILAAFRLMGLDLEATYDEVVAAYDDLIVTYAKDVKLKIKLQVAKDKILDFRLAQRLRSPAKSTVFDPFDRKEEKPLISIPPALQGIMELPTQETLVKNIVVFLVIGVLPGLSSSWASTSIGLGFAISLYLLYNRGAPDSGEMGAEMRPPKAKPLIMAVGISLLSGMVGATFLGTFMYGIVARIFSFVTQELLIGLGSAFGFCFAATLFKVQDEY